MANNLASNLGAVGVWSGAFRGNDDQTLAHAVELESLGYGALWIPGGAGGRVLEAVGRLLDATDHVPVATGILNIWRHDAAEIASQSLALGPRFLLGLGISHQALIGDDYQARSPIAVTREYLDALDAAGHPADRRVIAALGPKMLELARDRSAGTHPYFVPVEHTVAARQVVGPDKLVAPEVAVVLEPDPVAARQTARAFMVTYLNLPNYTNNILRFGFTTEDLADGGSDRLVDAIVAWGDEAAIADRIRQFHTAGADHVCVQVLGGDSGSLPMDSLRRLAPALTQL